MQIDSSKIFAENQSDVTFHKDMGILKSLFQSLKNAFVNNEEVQKFKNSHPQFISFFKKRFDTSQFTGLPLTFMSIAFIYIAILFLSSIIDYLTSKMLIGADVRVNILLYAFRDIETIRTLFWVALLGNISTVLGFAFFVSLFLWLVQKKWEIITLWFTIIGSEGCTYILKIFFHRPRPAAAVLVENTFSFPSAHATIAVALYGFLAYLYIRNTKNKKCGIFYALFTIIIILAIGFSQLYLGVHYVSDIWTGYMAGFLWLIAGIGVTEWKLFKKQNPFVAKKHSRLMNTCLCIAVIIFYVLYGLIQHPQLLLKIPPTNPIIISDITAIFSDYAIPRFTETLTGNTQEPINFVITVKDDSLLINNFKKAGWTVSDNVNVRSTIKLFIDAFFNKNYTQAPMTPSFWDKQVNTFGFEKSTNTNSARQRHHARFWKTDYKTSRGESIYVGTASLDIGIKWAITHKISPDIDTERELLFSDMQKAGDIKNFIKVQSVDPVIGKNFSGDMFFTDGKLYEIAF